MAPAPAPDPAQPIPLVTCLLLVDDDVAFSEIASQMLRGSYPSIQQIRVAATCADALSAIAAQPWDVILLDLNLPDSKGMVTVRLVTEAVRRSAAPLTPVVVCTGYYVAAEATASLALGVQDVVPKPMGSIQALVDSIDHARARTAHLAYLLRVLAEDEGA